MGSGITPEKFARDLVKEIQARNNPVFIGMVTGKVISPFPDIEIQINDKIVIDKTYIERVAEKLLPHKRRFNLITSYTDPKVVGSLQLKSENDPTESIVKLTLETKEDGTSTCEIEFVDTIQAGDEVILMPLQDQQKFYLLDKAVNL